MNDLLKHSHLMLDLETLAITEDARILSIGAVFFDFAGIKDKVHIKLSQTEEFDYYVSVSPSTIQWHLKENAETFKALMLEGKTTLASALGLLGTHYSLYYPLFIWANSPSFDLSILRYHYKNLDIHCPFSYSKDMDYRTLMKLHPECKVFSSLSPHDALEDAVAQAENVREYMKKISKIREVK